MGSLVMVEGTTHHFPFLSSLTTHPLPPGSSSPSLARNHGKLKLYFGGRERRRQEPASQPRVKVPSNTYISACIPHTQASRTPRTPSPPMSLIMTTTTEGYSCQREVYHPYSKLAEPGAVLFYESSDEEDEVGKVGSVSLVSIEIKSSPKASPKASTRITIRDAIVLRGEDAAETKVRSSPGKTAVLDAGDTSMKDIALESEEKTVEVEIPAGDEDIVMLDAILTASPSKPSTVASPSRTTHSPAAQSFTPPRPKRTPFDVLTPENTFGASSPFKIGTSDAAGKSFNKASPKAKEDYEIPGGFNG
ncbi:hypothetical protein DFP73DRAFT_532419 [Morchella snyderi]|nr:hypothetical protein DFP73DRAFT_532419 [Morchella snyderi]